MDRVKKDRIKCRRTGSSEEGPDPWWRRTGSSGEGPDPVDWTGLSKQGPDQVEKDWIEWIE